MRVQGLIPVQVLRCRVIQSIALTDNMLLLPTCIQVVMDSGLLGGTTRAEDAHGTPAQSHISPSILVYEDKHLGRALTVQDLTVRVQGLRCRVIQSIAPTNMRFITTHMHLITN